ncbi:7720_t:CDS:2 [Entrophospora sp. SA101]|nr:7720_t:CDS:2 [Entrophospora sp. SA101]CAJ0886652.1 12769_t:CDS:2 [Entrophospora sp. SA101]
MNPHFSASDNNIQAPNPIRNDISSGSSYPTHNLVRKLNEGLTQTTIDEIKDAINTILEQSDPGMTALITTFLNPKFK